jgi:hypothetical protein
MDENTRLAETASVSHVARAQELYNENSAAMGADKQTAVTHILLGRVIRELATLNVRIDTLAEILKNK